MALTPQATPLLSPEEIAVRAGQQVPFLHAPERASVFADREIRLRQLAASHAMRDFLIFAADLARAQHDLLQNYPTVVLPDAAALDGASRAGMPPLPADQWPRDPAWRDGLTRLLEALLPHLSTSPALPAVQALRAADAPWIEQQASRLLCGVMHGLDLSAAPLIAAALQTYFTHMVIATDAARGTDRLAPFGRTDDATLCPCCGSLPAASISRIGADASGYRYLHCSVCAMQWHMVRIKCAHCQGTKGIHYHSLQRDGDPANASKAAVEAETCDTCGHYLKIVHMERDYEVEPVADDLASVTLDLLVSEAGFERHGVNLMLLFGDAETEGEST